MKYSALLFLCLTSLLFSSKAQSLEEIKKLEADKKYEAAGILYHDLYMFPEAVDAFEKRIEFIKKQRRPNLDDLARADSLLKRSEQVARMISRCEDIQIVDSIIVDKASFLSAFVLGENVGTLLPSSNSMRYENQLGDKRFLGRKDTTGYFRLYSQSKVGDGWTEEKLLDIPSEEEGSDNYPFVMPDGMTVYYASTRNESIGGYDLFITRYNLNSDTYLTPNQMGMPFNSLYNDYAMAIDEENNVGFFVSDRFQPEDKVIVYAFIPNEEYTSLSEDISDEDRISRAQIRSIKDTWKLGMDYSNYLVDIKNNIEKEKQKKQRDFVFVINDNIIYYTLNDFESDAAKNLFLKWQNVQKEYDALTEDLEQKRKEYAGANASKRQAMRNAILTAEKKIEDLDTQKQQTGKETRNAEIKHLRQQQ